MSYPAGGPRCGNSGKVNAADRRDAAVRPVNVSVEAVA